MTLRHTYVCDSHYLKLRHLKFSLALMPVLKQKLSGHLLAKSHRYISTWSYEKGVSKHFVQFSQPPLSNSFFTVLFANVFFLVCFVARYLCRSGIRLYYYLTSPHPLRIVFSLPTILSFNTSDSYLKSARA